MPRRPALPLAQERRPFTSGPASCTASRLGESSAISPVSAADHAYTTLLRANSPPPAILFRLGRGSGASLSSNFVALPTEGDRPDRKVRLMARSAGEHQGDSVYLVIFEDEMATRESLQSAIEGFETSNDRLPSVNDELQSVDQELTTVNAEFQE